MLLNISVCVCVCVPDWGSSALGGFQQNGDSGVGLIERRLLVVRWHQGGCGEEGGRALIPVHPLNTSCAITHSHAAAGCCDGVLILLVRVNGPIALAVLSVLEDSPEILVVNWVMTGGPKPFTVDALIVKE